MKPPRAAGLVITACGIAACRTTAPEARPADGAAPATVIVPATPAQSASAGTAPPRAPKRYEFMTTAAWTKLRENWKAIDSAELRQGSKDPKIDEAGKLAMEALDELAKDPAAASVEPGVFEALKSIVSNRVAVLSGLEFRLMVSHMMPSAADLSRARVGTSLEQRIDALIELRKKGALSPEERDVALRGITGRMQMLVVLQSMHGYFMSDPIERSESLDDLQRVIEEQRASGTGAKDVIEQLEKGLAEARRMTPVIDAMVTDLER